MYESLWFLKGGVWNMLPLPGNPCVCFLGTSARGNLKEKGLEFTCTWSCYQDKGSALPLCDSDPDTPRWLLEWMTDTPNKGLYLGVCFQIENIPQLPAAKLIVLSEVVSNKKQFKLMQKYSEMYHLYPRMKRKVLMTTCSSLKCVVEIFKVCGD